MFTGVNGGAWLAIRVVISGLATVDYVAHAKGVFLGAGVMDMAAPPDGDWPRTGGAVLYAGAALVGRGRRVMPLTTLGQDDDGTLYLREAGRRGLDVAGVAVDPDIRTARCILIYNTDGTYGCLMQRAGGALTAVQRDLAQEADLVVIAAGDPDAGRAVLEAAAPQAKVAWIAKGDAASFPPDLAQALAARANFIFCNQAERAGVPAAGDACIIFETQGVDGVCIEDAAGSRLLKTDPVPVMDATGAGDTFAGAALAALLDGADTAAAAAIGMQAARRMLSARAWREEGA